MLPHSKDCKCYLCVPPETLSIPFVSNDKRIDLDGDVCTPFEIAYMNYVVDDWWVKFTVEGYTMSFFVTVSEWNKWQVNTTS